MYRIKSLFIIGCISFLLLNVQVEASTKQKRKIYQKEWIDLNKNGVKDIYEDPTQPIQKRVENLLSLMTVDEKSCQLATVYGFGRVLKDSLPTAQWNKELIRQAGEIAGKEAKALGYTNVYAPILNVVRDPRWGRTLECYGEDPYLIGALGTQMVNGIQSQEGLP